MKHHSLGDVSPAAREALEDTHPHRFCVAWQHTGTCRHIDAMVAIENAAFERGVTEGKALAAMTARNAPGAEEVA